MSLFTSLTTAISGMNAQSRALGHISDNVANSQTIGFKRTDTHFEDLLTQSSSRIHTPGAVSATPDATVSLQGSLEMVDNPLSIALSGNGLFSVARPAGRSADGSVAFENQQLFTRAGDFRKDSSGYLVNGSGYALQGWSADANGLVNQGVISPIHVDEAPMAAQETTAAALTANLPKSPTSAGPISTQFQIYNAAGDLKTVQLSWARSADPNTWTVSASDGASDIGSQTVTFDEATGRAPAGSALTFTGDFGQGSQTVTLDLSNVTQHAGTAYEQSKVTVNGETSGSFRSVSIRDSGDVVVSYDNGASRTIGRVPVVTFSNPDALQRMDGQAFGLTAEAGTMQVQTSGTKGAGTISASAVEHSNVDIAAEFTKLIVAQRAYTANTRIVTTTDEMLEETINMRR
jgi:flagellar hook protein FlgE